VNTKDRLKIMREVEQANKRHEQEWKEAQESASKDDSKEVNHEQADTNDRK